MEILRFLSACLSSKLLENSFLIVAWMERNGGFVWSRRRDIENLYDVIMLMFAVHSAASCVLKSLGIRFSIAV